MIANIFQMRLSIKKKSVPLFFTTSILQNLIDFINIISRAEVAAADLSFNSKFGLLFKLTS